MDPQPGKRKRGRPRKELVTQQAEGDSPLWAIVDQLTLIRDELHQFNKLAAITTGPAGPGAEIHG